MSIDSRTSNIYELLKSIENRIPNIGGYETQISNLFEEGDKPQRCELIIYNHDYKDNNKNK